MESISQIAQTLDISSSTIREYLERFPEFFPDPVEKDGVKVYPPETMELIKKIHEYYQTSMTKEQIRVKLGGKPEEEILATGPVTAAIDPDRLNSLEKKMDSLISVIENLTAAISDAGTETFKRIKNQVSTSEKLNDLNRQISNILELKKGETSENIEKNVLDADGTIIFSFGKLSAVAADSKHFAKAHKKPWIHLDLEKERHPSGLVKEWLTQFDIKILNVAGRNASRIPGLKRSIDDMISLILQE